MDVNNQKGQTMVEYMLLMAVSVSLIITFLNSEFVKTTFGTGGKLGTMIKGNNQFSYRHAFATNHPPDISRENKDGRSHPSYYQDNGDTHFFGPKDIYPK